MATLSDYKGSISLIAGLKPASSGYPLVEAHDVQVATGDVRLDTKLTEISTSLGSSSDAANASGTSVWSRVKKLQADVGTAGDGDSISARLSTAEGNITNLRSDLGTKPSGHAAAFASITALESTVSGHTTAIGTDTTEGSIKGRIKELEDEIGGTGSENSISARIGALETEVGMTGTSTTSLNARVTTNTNNIATANANISNLQSGLGASTDTASSTGTTAWSRIKNTESSLGTSADAAAAAGTTAWSRIKNAEVDIDNIQAGLGQSTDAVNAQATAAWPRIKALETQTNALQGNMIVVTAAAQMTDQNAFYIYQNATPETGYADGHWYYYSGGAWVDGGAVAGVTIDDLLETQGAAADAKATGDAISQLSSDLDRLKNLTLYEAARTLPNFSIGYYWHRNTGSSAKSSKCARTTSLVNNRKAVTFTNSNYQYWINGYSGTPAGESTFIGEITQGRTNAGVITLIPSDIPVFTLVVRRIDEADIQESEQEIIRNGFVFYNFVDSNLIIENAPADSKAVGDFIKTCCIFPHGTVIPDNYIELGVCNSQTTGSPTYDSYYARSRSLATKNRKAVTFTNDNYSFSVIAYSGTPINSNTYVRSLTNGNWFPANSIVLIPDDISVINVNVRKIDGSTIENSEIETIQHAFVFYVYTDKSLTLENVPADAKVVGELIEKIGVNDNSFYISTDDISLVPTYEGVISLYDDLVSNYSYYVSKNVLTVGSNTNYEYVFTTGNYNKNRTAFRGPDSEIAKPTLLMLTGVHGYERSSVMSMYGFCKSLCEDNYALKGIKDCITIRLIPVVNPWGFTNNERLTSQGVDINRNFDTTTWQNYESDQKGSSAADQWETQIVQNWILLHNDATMFIDWHNSSRLNEITCLLSADPSQAISSAKHKYLEHMNNIIPYWRRQRKLDETTISNIIYAYSGTGASGVNLAPSTRRFAQEHGFSLAFALETSWNIKDTGKHSSFSIGVGTEAISAILDGFKSYFELT